MKIYFNDNTETRVGMLVRETDERYCVHVLETREEIRFHVDELVTIDDSGEWADPRPVALVFIDTNQ